MFKIRYASFMIVFSLMGALPVLAASLPYTDIPVGTWYTDAVVSMFESGYLDRSHTLFRPTDNITRAEATKLVVLLNGGLINTLPTKPSFDDVSMNDWYFPYIEEAAKEGWIHGDGNCYGTHPCYVFPNASIKRAETAAIVVRAYNLQTLGFAPKFSDVVAGQWYTDAIQAVADHCLLNGDDSTLRVRPNDNMNRAETVVLLNRIDQKNVNGTECEWMVPPLGMRTVEPVGEHAVRITFRTNVDETSIADISRYSLHEGSGSLTILSAKILHPFDAVELGVKESIPCGRELVLSVNQMSVAADKRFSDSLKFQSLCSD